MGFLYSFLFCLIFGIIYLIYQKVTYERLNGDDWFCAIVGSILAALGVWAISTLLTCAILTNSFDNGKTKNFEQIDSASYVIITGEDNCAVYYNKENGHYNFAYYVDGVPIGKDIKEAGKVVIHTDVRGESPRITVHIWKIKKSMTFNSKLEKPKSSKNINIFKKQLSNINNNSSYNNSKDKEKNEKINENNNNELLINIKRNEKINIINILIQCIIKGLNDESLKTIMNIFGLSGAMDPFEIEKLFINQDISIYHLDGNLYEQEYFDDNDFKITKYNPKTEMTKKYHYPI